MQGTVIVTGASTGIGAETARYLGSRDFQVFGTVRDMNDGVALERHGVVPIRMDVTDTASIEQARQSITSSIRDRPLVGLVNNAGIATLGPLEHMPMEDFRRVFEVNVFGVVAIIQQFLPELKRARGRIVNISSVSGLLAFPFGAAYSGSKFALEAISDALRRELVPFGVRVTLIEPGSVRTAIWNKMAALDMEYVRHTPYERILPGLRDQAVKGGRRGLPASRIAHAVHRALTTPRPPARMLVTKRPLTNRVTRLLPDWLIDKLIANRVWGAQREGAAERGT